MLGIHAVRNTRKPQAVGPRPLNWPLVKCSGLNNIRKCHGCKKPITAEEKKSPHNLVFGMKGMRMAYAANRKEFYEREDNVYFHLDMKCLLKHDPQISMHQIAVSDEEFLKLTDENFEVLHGRGFARSIMANKK